MYNKQNQSTYKRLAKKRYLELTLLSGSTSMCRLSHLTIKYIHIPFNGKKYHDILAIHILQQCLYSWYSCMGF